MNGKPVKGEDDNFIKIVLSAVDPDNRNFQLVQIQPDFPNNCWKELALNINVPKEFNIKAVEEFINGT